MTYVHRSRRLAVVGALMGIALVGGCSSSAKSGSATSSTSAGAATTASSAPATTSAACRAAGEFKDSLSALASPSTVAGGKTGIQAAVDSVKSSLDNLRSTLKSGDKPKVDALQSSLSDLQKAVDDMRGVSGLSAVASAAQSVGESGKALLDAVEAGCPSA